LMDWLHAHFTRGPGASAAEESAAVTGDQKLVEITQQINQHPLLRNAPDALPSYVPASDFSLALLEVLRDGSSLPLFSQIESTVAGLPPGDLKTVLAAFVHAAAGDIDKLRAHIERWFDAAMDRVSGIYKRHSQYMLLILGAVLAVVLDVNAFHLAHRLWYEPSARAALVANAGSANPDISLSEAWGRLRIQPLPLGRTEWEWPRVPEIGGWIVSALAISLGAPFWFDLFRKLGNLRSAGPRPGEANRAPSL
ncbi:MAG: hypothetical protein ACREFP_05580, partial [Acetobacteraceae bacterium]